MSLPLHEKHNLMACPSNLEHLVRLEDLQCLLYQPSTMAPGGGHNPLTSRRGGRIQPKHTSSNQTIESSANGGIRLSGLIVPVWLVDDPSNRLLAYSYTNQDSHMV